MKSRIKILMAGLLGLSSLCSETVMAQSWSLTGNAGTNAGTNFIGTTDNVGFRLRTNNVARLSISSGGKIGIGTISPIWKLDVSGGSINTDSVYRITGQSVLSLSSSGIQIGSTSSKVGIGTSTPTDALQVVGTIAATGGKSSDWNAAYSWGNHATQSYLKGTSLLSNRIPFWNGTTMVTSNISENSGYIGLGTSSPVAPLHVNAAAQEMVRINGGNNLYVSFYESGNYRGYFGSYSGATSDVDFGTGGSNTTGSVHMVIGAIPKLSLIPSGNVGIGTTGPVSRLSIVQTGTSFPTMEASNTDKGPNISYTHFGPLGDWYLRSAANSGKVILQDQSTGTVAIGTTYVPTGYKLAVSGKIICSELKVQLPGAWPDYVFDTNYKLMTFSDLREYVSAHKHLPGIPSAADVEKDGGLEIGEIQRLLMEKVEELTLYILHQDDKIRSLEATMNLLKK